MKRAPTAVFPHFTNEERAAAFILGHRDARKGFDRSANPYGTVQARLRDAWDAGHQRANDKVKSHLQMLGNGAVVRVQRRQPRLIVTWREAYAWAIGTAGEDA